MGNVPLAVVLWKGGISFGGVVAFIFADLIIAPILNIYRKYYGRKMAAFLLATFFAAMALAGYAVELIFGGLGLIPSPATAKIPDQGVSWDYTTWLNIVFLILAAALIIRFIRTGGPAMLKMMGGRPPPADSASAHAGGRAHHGAHGVQGMHGVHRRHPWHGRAGAACRAWTASTPGARPTEAAGRTRDAAPSHVHALPLQPRRHHRHRRSTSSSYRF